MTTPDLERRLLTLADRFESFLNERGKPLISGEVLAALREAAQALSAARAARRGTK